MPGRSEVPDMEAFVADYGVSGFEHAIDDTGDLWQTFGITSQPSFAFINDNGTIETHRGALGATALAARVEALTLP